MTVAATEPPAQGSAPPAPGPGSAPERTPCESLLGGKSGFDRRRIEDLLRAHVRSLGLVPPLTLQELGEHADRLLPQIGLDPRYRSLLMLLIYNEAWRETVAAVPFARRTLLLPPCLRSSSRCRARFDEFGLLCERCGSCALAGLVEEAEDLGYAVFVVEGTSIVGSMIEQGLSEAAIGLSCVASLEKAFPAMAANPIPSMAVPLLRDGCKDTAADGEWLRELIRLKSDAPARPCLDFDSIHREIRAWFEPEALRRILRVSDHEIERIGLDWLAKAGKRWRPFLAVAVYRALRDDPAAALPPRIRDVALAVECIHKGSLIYDDIQDGDARRYGEDTVHSVHGVPVALTAALFLIGEGYRLLAQCDAPADRRTAMLALIAEAHCELCLGQGRELGWMRAPSVLSPRDVLAIFEKKTAPSFDAVFRLGAFAADAGPEILEALRQYSRHVGVAYQIRDDLDDYAGGGDADDLQRGRPSIVMALAYERAEGQTRETLARAWCGKDRGNEAPEIRRLVDDLGAADGARELLADSRVRALEALRPLRNRDLKILLHRVVGRMLSA